jgi:hypothetical protein
VEDLQGKLTASEDIVCVMNTAIIRARQMSLVLLIVAVIDCGHPRQDYSGASPASSGLTRLGRDLMRRGESTRRMAASG